jgi:8-oxo-dGTP pyrophosphatase MutT (NUDIX family)
MSFGAGALIFQNGHVLTCLRGMGESEPLTWGTFGGMAEAGEDPLACMLREVEEESGIDLSGFDAHLIDTFEEGNGFTYYTYAVFLRELRDSYGRSKNERIDNRKIGVGSEVEDWRWSKIIPDTDVPEEFWRHVRHRTFSYHGGSQELTAPLVSGLDRLTKKPEVVRAIKSLRLLTTGGGI